MSPETEDSVNLDRLHRNRSQHLVTISQQLAAW